MNINKTNTQSLENTTVLPTNHKRVIKTSTTGKPLMAGSFKVKLVDLEELIKINENRTKNYLEALSSDGETGYLSGYMSTFNNKDRDGDVIRPGAFTKTLKERTPKILYQHDARYPIGILVDAYEDSKGLYGVIKLNMETQLGKEVFSHYQLGSMDAFSIGFQLEKYTTVVDQNTGYSSFDISEVRLWEVSAVTFPANELAIVDSVKEHYEELTTAVTSVIEEKIKSTDTIEEMIEVLQAVKDAHEHELLNFFGPDEEAIKEDEEVFAFFVGKEE